MPFITGATLALQLAAAATTAYGTYESSKATSAIAKQSQEAEALRKQQMELESQRRQREIIRNVQTAEATSLSSAVNRGASADGSSLLPGITGQVEGQAARSTTALYENTKIGEKLFDINANIAGLQASKANYQAVSSFGSSLFQSAPALGRIGGQAYGYGRSLFGEGYGSWEAQVYPE